MEEGHRSQNENEEESKLDSEQDVKQRVEEQLCECNEIMPESDNEIAGDENSEISWEDIEEERGSSRHKQGSYSETAQMRKRQRLLKELELLLLVKDSKVQKIREELKEYRKRMESLKVQRNKVEEDIQEQQTAGNIAALFRLRALHRRLCEELREEEDLYSNTVMTLQENEHELFKVELEQAKLVRLHEQHKKEEEEYEVQRSLEAKQRLEAHEAASLQAEKRIKAIKTQPMQDIKVQKMEHRKPVENARLHNQKAVQFLKESMARVRQEQAKKELQIREDLEKRMQSILSLKKNIELNQENERAIQLRRKAQAAVKEKEKRKEAMIIESGIAHRFMIYEKHQQENEKRKREFKEQQDTSKAEIMAKILREESNMEKKKRINWALFPEKAKSLDNISGSREPREKLQEYLKNICEDNKFISINEQNEWRVPSPDYEEEATAGQNRLHQVAESTEDEDEESLCHPEFSGLWNHEQKPHKDEPIKKHLGAGTSKMEQEIFARHLEKQRSGIVHKQVAAGREFKGCPFYSKPGVIHFQNFDVGKTYKKRVSLINASYGITYCKLIGISDHMKDFIEVEFKPPGPLSAGMSCEMTVIFKSMQNKDLEGELMFRAQTGSFAVPLKCTTKKCDLSVDKTFVDFGPHVIGETVSQTINLTNRGAQGTYFEFLRLNFTTSVPKEPRSEQTTSTGNEENNGKDLFDIGHPISNEIKIGQVTKDMIDPFSSIKLPIIFLPTDPGYVQADLELVFFSGAYKNISIKVQAQAIDVPVWVSDPNIDLKICMYDRLYQDAICVHNRASIRHQIKFEVCKELRHHLEFLPKSGYIPAHSSLSFQLKFLPRKSLPEDAKIYFNEETLVLEAPMNIWVTNQIRSIPFMIHAIVTCSDIEIDQQTIDFGPCSIYETVLQTVQLRNRSILSQEFGFVGIPEYVDVQPNDGFGVLLPLESLSLDIMFNAKQAKEYNFELICKSEINRDFTIFCKAVGVLPPLHLSHSRVHFAATALNDTAIVTLHVMNSHTSRNEFTHPVPRIGNGEIAPVGPTSFEFVVPESSYLTIVPAVGTVMPGQKCQVVLMFKPMLSDLEVQKEAVRMLFRAEETRRILEKQELESSAKSEQDSSNKKKPQSKQKDLKEHSSSSLKPQLNTPFKPPDPSDIAVDSDDYNAALASLLRSFKEQFHSFVIPCFIKHGDTTSHKKEGFPPYSIHNTLYLEVNCPTVAPPLIVIPCNKRSTVNFGENAVGKRVLKKVMVQNISQDDLDLQATVLDPGGPFQLLSFLRALQPGETQNLIFSFTPTESKLFYESMEISTAKANISLVLTGYGVAPKVICSVEKVLDMGYVLANQKRTMTFQLQNATRLHVMFDVKLKSLSYSKYKDQQVLPLFLTSNEIPDHLVGTQNYGGQSVFSVSPIKGCIEAMQTQEFEVTFSPDHENQYYSDVIHVELFDKVSHSIQLKGAAREHLMFVEGGDPIDVPMKSLSILPSYETMDVTDVSQPLKSILLSLKSVKSDNKYTTASREFQVGCIQSTHAAGKKSVEFIIDNPQAVHVQGFAIDPLRAVVEAGTTRTVTVSWTPHSEHDALQIISATVKMSVKGDITENYQIILMPVVVVT